MKIMKCPKCQGLGGYPKCPTCLNKLIVKEEADDRLDLTTYSSSWMPIETAPITDHGYFFARIAWGPDEDKSTGDGVRHKGEWYAASLFYRNGRDRQYGFSEHRVVPTHWKPHDLFQPNAESTRAGNKL